MENNLQEWIKTLPLRSKLAQLTQLNAAFVKADSQAEITGLPEKIDITEEEVAELCSVLNFKNGKEAREIQDKYLRKSKHRIPLIFMMDVIHGYKTIFPIPLAMGCAFDEQLIEACAEMSAVEAKYNGVAVTFSPMVDLVRDARWGRVMESTGEDSYLNGKFGRAFIRGYKKGGIGACVKHFACYGAAESGRDYNTTDISPRTLHEQYLSAYKECLKEEPEMVMTSFNALNGVPMNGHKDLLVDLLREEWEYEGVVISDYAGIKEMIRHGYLETEKECAEVAINNKIDIEMMSATYIRYAEELIAEGRLKEERIDEMLLRVLSLKNKFGLFDNAYFQTDEEKAKEVELCEAHRTLARIAAEKSCVLLKNESVLPLQRETEIALIGPFAEEKAILGNWACAGKAENAVSVLEGVERLTGRKAATAVGCYADLLSEDISGIQEAVEKAKNAEVIVACIGERALDSGEGASRAKLEIAMPQIQLVKRLKELGKPVVAVVFAGRPQVLTELEKYADAILYAWQPGTEGGNAIARLLYGEVAPSGKLTMSFPRTTGQCPIYYNTYSTGRPRDPDTLKNSWYNSSYRDELNAPLYPFGYGLSYTEFEILEMRLSAKEMTVETGIDVYVKVKNVGKRAGEEVVQLYIHDLYATAIRPIKELKDYQKIFLQPSEERELVFHLTEETLRFYNDKLEYVSEQGAFEVMVGTSSETTYCEKFVLYKE